MFKHIKINSLVVGKKQANSLLNYNKSILTRSTKNSISKNFNNGLIKTPRRNFSSPFDNLPGMNPILKGILIGNTLIYFLGFSMSEGQYVRTFLYNRDSIQQGKLQVLLTSHFAKVNFFDYAIDTLLTGLIGLQVSTLSSAVVFQKLISSSVLISMGIMLTMHKDMYYVKSEAILRGIIMYMIFLNPNMSFYMIPFPFQIRAMYIGVFLVLIDLISRKHCNFGGTIAAYLLTRRLI